ncbi:hypothetical protein LEP1GSC070_0750 [Leptospira santarosai str. AIM]|nr:hypothetical protein LEP1GSC070_0750 [Leptospira santarosai str. AIM]
MNVFSVGFPRVYRFLITSFLHKNKTWEFPHFKSHTTINRTFILNSKPGNVGVPTFKTDFGFLTPELTLNYFEFMEK